MMRKSFRGYAIALVLAIAFIGAAGCISESTKGITDEGFVVFKVEPSSAEIWVDGHLEGKAREFSGSRKVLRLSSGPHKLEIRREGYETYQQDLYAGAGAKQTITVRLHELPGGK